MSTKLDENTLFSEKVHIIRKFLNIELKYIQYFYEKTCISPENLLIYQDYIFFFINYENYFKARMHIKAIRRDLRNKKILIIRSENTLLRLLISFFPDLYIYDIKIDHNPQSKEKVLTVFFLFCEECGIAIGPYGEYIKMINDIIQKFTIFEKEKIPMKIKCELTHLLLPWNFF